MVRVKVSPAILEWVESQVRMALRESAGLRPRPRSGGSSKRGAFWQPVQNETRAAVKRKTETCI